MNAARKGRNYRRTIMPQTLISAPANDSQKIEGSIQGVLTKLANLSKALASIGLSVATLMEKHDVDKNKKLDLDEFQKAIEASGASISFPEAFNIFEYLDGDKDQFVTLDEFLSAIQTAASQKDISIGSQPFVSRGNRMMTVAPARNMPLTPPRRRDARKTTMKESYEMIGTSEDEVHRNFVSYMDKIKIEESDYFMNVKTILNDPMKALKKCVDIVNELKAKKSGKMLFEDPDFGPSQKDPFGFNSISFDPPYRGAPNPQDVAWCRPKEISPDVEPEFLVDGATSNDVNQGALGDCWLIGAMSILSSNDAYIRGNFKPNMEKPLEVSAEEKRGMMIGLYPPIFHQFRKYGIYVIRFFKNFQWRYVIIDDKLPCYTGQLVPQLRFASCTSKNEFWVPLVEKAYAKIHRCYQSLFSGDISDGLTDFTGLVPEKLIIQNKSRFNKEQLGSKDKLWQLLIDIKRSGALMGCSIVGTGSEESVFYEGEDTGLVNNHAYSIQSVVEVVDRNKTKCRLVRVRNPWGSKKHKEWTGEWCDDSEEMAHNYEAINQVILAMDKQEAELINPEQKKDGNFFMSFDDFTNIFCKLSICHKFPSEYTGYRFSSKWEGQNAGGTPYKGTDEQKKRWKDNTQYLIKVVVKTHVFISLGQEDGRLRASSEEIYPFSSSVHPVILIIMKAPDGKPASFDPSLIVAQRPFKQFKEISLNITLDPGSYVIVPSTQDIGQQGPYYLSIYGPGNISLVNLSTQQSPDTIPEEDEQNKVMADDELAKFLKLKAAETIFN